MNLKTIERGEVKKDSPIAGETRIDDVAIIYNRWIKSKAEIRTIAPVQYPGYCMGYESVRRYHQEPNISVEQSVH